MQQKIQSPKKQLLSSIYLQSPHCSAIHPSNQQTDDYHPSQLNREIAQEKSHISGGEKLCRGIEIVFEREELCDDLHSLRINIKREEESSEDEVELIDKHADEGGVLQHKGRECHDQRNQC